MKLLTDKRVKWGRQRSVETFSGDPLTFPASVAAKYRDELDKEIRAMVAEYQKALFSVPGVTSDESIVTTFSRILRGLGDKWAKRFAERSRTLAEQMIARTDRYSKANLNKSLKELSGGLTLKTPDMPAGLYDKLLASIKENVGLIRSIPSDYHGRIEEAVMRSIQTGGEGSKTLIDEIRNIGKSTEKRAELIAVDQTRKVTAAMNSERMKAVGLKKFEWLHSGGGKEPRRLHVEYDGQILDLDDPPVIDERTGERGLPGQLINCRCRMRPIVDFTQYLEEQ